jgi:predicted transcriptional regulator
VTDSWKNVTKRRKEKIQIHKVRNEKGKLTTNIKVMEGIIRYYFDNLYSNKLVNLEQMDKFLHTYDHTKQSQENISHLKRYMTCNETAEEIKSLTKNMCSGPDIIY